MNANTKLQGDLGGDDPLPTSPDPLSPKRTDLNPNDAPGAGESPDNDGEVPVDLDGEPALHEN